MILRVKEVLMGINTTTSIVIGPFNSGSLFESFTLLVRSQAANVRVRIGLSPVNAFGSDVDEITLPAGNLLHLAAAAPDVLIPVWVHFTSRFRYAALQFITDGTGSYGATVFFKIRPPLGSLTP
jgi:hypothetical protein